MSEIKTEKPNPANAQVRKRPDGSTKIFLSRRAKRRMRREGALPFWGSLTILPRTGDRK